MEGETEREIIAAHDQKLQTKYHATKLLPTEADSKCRMYQQFHERVQRIISVCPVLAKELYFKRHDRVSAELDFMCKETAIQSDNKHRYDHVLYQNQSQRFMKVRLPYYGTNKCEPTELFLTITRKS